MITVVLVVHLILAVALVCVVLLQKSEGGALGMGGGGMSGFMTGRSTANLLTRTTAVLALLFFLTSISLAYLAARQRTAQSPLNLPAMAPTAPSSAPTGPAAPSPLGPVKAPVAVPGKFTPAAPKAGAPAAPAAKPAAPAAPSAPLTK